MMSNPEALLFDLSKKINPVDSKNAVIFVAGNIGFDFFDVTKLALSPVTSEKKLKIQELNMTNLHLLIRYMVPWYLLPSFLSILKKKR